VVIHVAQKLRSQSASALLKQQCFQYFLKSNRPMPSFSSAARKGSLDTVRREPVELHELNATYV